MIITTNKFDKKINNQTKFNWKEEARISQKLLFGYAKTLPDPLCALLKEYYEYRKGLSHENMMFGEIAPFFIGSALGISDKNIYKILKTWNLLYFHCLVFDDLLDERLENINLHYILANVLYDDFIGELKFSFSDFQVDILHKTLQYKKEAFEGMLIEETYHNQNDFPLNVDNQIRNQGQKAFVVKSCVQMLVSLEFNRLMTKEEINAIENLCYAVQMLDDIKDFNKDLKTQKNNYLLEKLRKYLLKVGIENQSYLNNLSENQLMLLLSVSNGLEESYDKISYYLDEMISSIGHLESKGTAFLDEISKNSIKQRDHLNTLKRENPRLFYKLKESLAMKKEFSELNLKEYSKLINVIKSGPMASQ